VTATPIQVTITPGGSDSLETLEPETVVLVTLLVLAGLAVPVTAIGWHQRKRRTDERAAGLRRKEKIRL
jgi:hypothetical protein